MTTAPVDETAAATTDAEARQGGVEGHGAPAGPGSRRRVTIVLALVAGALAFLLFQGLGNATVYFKTADEAVAQRTSLGTHRFRIEGAVVPGSVRRQGDDVAFAISGKTVQVPVVHRGDPPELFRDGIPVVLEGRFRGAAFTSDRIMVKHTEQYTEDHPDRTADYGGKPGTPAAPASP
jgi:cytochrome c-type biogenesis protein CcmE